MPSIPVKDKRNGTEIIKLNPHLRSNPKDASPSSRGIVESSRSTKKHSPPLPRESLTSSTTLVEAKPISNAQEPRRTSRNHAIRIPSQRAAAQKANLNISAAYKSTMKTLKPVTKTAPKELDSHLEAPKKRYNQETSWTCVQPVIHSKIRSRVEKPAQVSTSSSTVLEGSSPSSSSFQQSSSRLKKLIVKGVAAHRSAVECKTVECTSDIENTGNVNTSPLPFSIDSGYIEKAKERELICAMGIIKTELTRRKAERKCRYWIESANTGTSVVDRKLRLRKEVTAIRPHTADPRRKKSSVKATLTSAPRSQLQRPRKRSVTHHASISRKRLETPASPLIPDEQAERFFTPEDSFHEPAQSSVIKIRSTQLRHSEPIEIQYPKANITPEVLVDGQNPISPPCSGTNLMSAFNEVNDMLDSELFDLSDDERPRTDIEIPEWARDPSFTCSVRKQLSKKWDEDELERIFFCLPGIEAIRSHTLSRLTADLKIIFQPTGRNVLPTLQENAEN